ncbi:MAG TPA: cyclic nucleotide-binding domain-containing protein [Bryobacteraceae bacterium]|nr:cyclic nucleotide-binding domain-containing protein [Bryobacteraceae bacterium]
MKTTAVNPKVAQRILIAAQLLALLQLVLALNFLLNTTGGTLFLFASFGPLLVLAAIALMVGVGIYKYRQSHHLFDMETYSPGEVIVRQEEAGVCAYFIQDGQVEVVRNEQGKDQVIATLGKDEYFGEMALLSNAPRNATVRALKETRVAALGKENFVRLLAVMPATKESVLQTVQARAKEVAAGQ